MEIDIFYVEYLKRPTFRDLFIAVYITSLRLTEDEKIFDRNSKTDREAKAIVSKSPLTNDRFASVMSDLTDRFLN